MTGLFPILFLLLLLLFLPPPSSSLLLLFFFLLKSLPPLTLVRRFSIIKTKLFCPPSYVAGNEIMQLEG